MNSKTNGFASQFHGAADSNKGCLFIAYVRFDVTNSLREDLLFCECVKNRATAEELFKMLDCFRTENGLKRERTALVFAVMVHRPCQG